MFAIVSLVIIFSLAILIATQQQRLKQLRALSNNLKKSLEEMDEQAKLIVRTDMELNKIQENLDKKVTGLNALQKVSRMISTTLEESQIFKRIEPGCLEDMGFEKACVFLWNDKERKFYPQLNIGYAEEEIKAIRSSIDLKPEYYRDIIKEEKSISSISESGDARNKDLVNSVFKTVSFTISPILPKEGDKGFLFVGTENVDTIITEGDEELITIFTNHIGEALENARLFEKTWRSQQDLENKVEQRTRELSAALEEVKKISKHKTDFISSVSHELRTPLTSIKGYASILLSGKLGALPKEVGERLEKINRHSDELTYFINDLLDISRLESGKVIMKQEAGDLNKIVEKISDLLSVQLKAKDIKLETNLAKDAKDIFVDVAQIERVFINIVGNAIKFTPQEGRITINSRKADNQIRVDISDTGCGIPPEAKEAIFEEFYRVDNEVNQQLKGTGLGLALVKRIIESHGGRIWAEGTLGKGTTFSFTLPLTNLK